MLYSIERGLILRSSLSITMADDMYLQNRLFLAFAYSELLFHAAIHFAYCTYGIHCTEVTELSILLDGKLTKHLISRKFLSSRYARGSQIINVTKAAFSIFYSASSFLFTVEGNVELRWNCCLAFEKIFFFVWTRYCVVVCSVHGRRGHRVLIK